MADSFSFEFNSNKKFLLENFSHVDRESLETNPNFQKLIEFFDQDGDNTLSVTNNKRKNEWKSVFDTLKSCAGEDGIISDSELNTFINNNSELTGVTVEDIKKFVEVSQIGYFDTTETDEILRNSLPRASFTGYTNNDGYYVSVTEIKERGVLVRKEEIIHSNPPMEKTSYYKDGNLDYARILTTQDDLEMEYFIQYENGKPSFALNKINGINAFTVIYREDTRKEKDQNGEEIDTGENIVVMQITAADGSVRYISVNEVDENGQFNDENIRSVIIEDEDGIRAYNKLPFLTDDGMPTDNYYYLESYMSNDGTHKEEIAYNTETFCEIGSGGVNKLSHTIEDGEKVYSVMYDGNGNTQIYFQNGEGIWDLYKSFGQEEQSWQNFEKEWQELNPNHSRDVGSSALVVGEFSPDSEQITTRVSSEEAREQYTKFYVEQSYKTAITSENLDFSLTKNYSRLWDLAKDILIAEYQNSNPSNNEINQLMFELIALNGNFTEEKLQSGQIIKYPTAMRVSDDTRERLEELSFEAVPENNLFYTRVANLTLEQQEIAINAIAKYREEGKTDAEIKHLILNEFNINLFDSGRTVQLSTGSDEFFLKTVLSDSQISELGNVKYGIEEIVTDIVGLELDSEEGQKLYRKLLMTPDESLRKIPFGLLKSELSSNPTCSEVESLVEEMTLFTASIRFNEDGTFDKAAYEANYKKERTDLPQVVGDYLQYVFNLLLDKVREALDDLEADENVVQNVLNWFAERIEACGGNTDNKKDVTQALSREQGQVNGIDSNPASNFRSLVGSKLSYENIIHLLKGEFKLDSMRELEAVAGNYDSYNTAFKALVMGVTTAIAIIGAPFTSGGSLALLGNVAWVSLAAGTASLAADGILSNGNMSFEDSLKSAAGGMFFGATVSTCNMLGSGIMMNLFPRHVVSGMSFNEVALGNTYCGNFFTRAGLYITESAFQSTGQYFVFNNGEIIPLEMLSTSTFAGVAAFFGTKTAVQAYRSAKATNQVAEVTSTLSDASKNFDNVTQGVEAASKLQRMTDSELEAVVSQQAGNVENLVAAGGGVAFMNWLAKSKLVNGGAKLVPTTFDAKVRFVNGDGETVHNITYTNPEGKVETLSVIENENEEDNVSHRIEVKNEND